MTSQLPIVAISLVAIVPLAFAQSTTYVGPGRLSVGDTTQTLVLVCDPGIGSGVGGGCSYPCVRSCTVTVTDAFGAPQPYRVCSWDGAHHRDCINAGGSTTYLSSADEIDVFVENGVVGQIAVS